MDYYNNNQNETGTGGFQNDPFSSTPFSGDFLSGTSTLSTMRKCPMARKSASP